MIIAVQIPARRSLHKRDPNWRTVYVRTGTCATNVRAMFAPPAEHAANAATAAAVA